MTRYGHDLRGEVLGDEGAVQVGSLRRRPLLLLDRDGVHHDTVHTTDQRMGDAFGVMLQAFVDCVRRSASPPVTAADARATLAVAIAATRSVHTGSPVDVDSGEAKRVPERASRTTISKE